MTYTCPTCGQWWTTHPSGLVTTSPTGVRTCSDCARAQADHDDTRADARLYGEGT